MKTYKASTTRAWIKILACICAVNALLYQGVNAVCAQQVAPGDQGVGISAIDDATCKLGGIGCFQDVCRYCKTRDTTQSQNFKMCPTYAAPAPTSAPVVPVTATTPTAAPTGTCASTVAVGDQGVGISAVEDASCKNGGTGCFADGVCRFCKTRDTDQSKNFVACSGNPAAPAPETPTVVGGAQSVTTITCVSCVAQGDQAMGISAYADAACTNGGLGCFIGQAGTCRYCKTRDTDQARQYLACPTTTTPAYSSPVVTTATTQFVSVPTATCAATVSVGDQGVGISAATDATCNNGGIGCFASGVCRFCKTRDTDQSRQFVACSTIAI